MIYLFYGDELFLVQEALARVRESLGDPEMLGLNTTTLDGAKVGFLELRAACDTVPFLAAARLVIVDGLLGRFEPSRTSARQGAAARGRGRRDASAEWAPLKEYLPLVPPSTHLVFMDGRLDRSPLLGVISPVAQVEQGRKLRGATLEEWVRRRAALRETKIDQAAVRLLVQTATDDLSVLDSEIEKLSIYAGNRPIQSDDVGELVTQARESTIFILIDAVAARQLGDAQRSLHRLLDAGETPGVVLSMLGREFRQLLIAQGLSSRGVKGNELMSRLGIRSSWALGKTLDRARGHRPELTKAAMIRVLETDVAIKNGRQDAEVALDLLVAELCRGSEGR